MIISITIAVSFNMLSELLNNLENIWLPIITSVLSSSVIVGIFQFIQWNKNKKLENITVERKIWRDDLRKIVEELQNSRNNRQIDLTLAKLKVRINPKGMFVKSTEELSLNEKKDYFNRDSYLWELIKMIEASSDFEQRKLLVPDLIELISLLIKYDWDRAKGEISYSNSSKAIFLFFLFFACILFHILILDSLVKPNERILFIDLLFCIVYPVFIPYWRYRVTLKMEIDCSKKNSQQCVRLNNQTINKFFMMIKQKGSLNNQITTLICYIILLVILSVIIAFDWFNFISGNDINYTGLVMQSSCSIFAIILYFLTTYFVNISKYIATEYYYGLILKILKRAKNRKE